jgi:hypothetical protein
MDHINEKISLCWDKVPSSGKAILNIVCSLFGVAVCICLLCSFSFGVGCLTTFISNPDDQIIRCSGTINALKIFIVTGIGIGVGTAVIVGGFILYFIFGCFYNWYVDLKKDIENQENERIIIE